MITSDLNCKIFLAGHRGMVGSIIKQKLEEKGFKNIITVSKSELDLRDQEGVNSYIKSVQPDVVIVAAAVVGGIAANNNYPWKFLYENLMIEANLINSSHENGVENLLFLGSSCVYPKHANQPLKEEYLLSGPLEPTNQWYAVAKIAGIKMCQALNKQFDRSYISLMPTNLYGPNDNFDLETSHVLPAMIRKFHDAKIDDHRDVELWGTGNPLREFLYVSDMADAIVFILTNPDENDYDLINIGTGKDCTIEQLASIVQNIVGHQGTILWDKSKPDGTPRKLMDVSKINDLGWEYKTDLRSGIKQTYEWFVQNRT